MYEIQAGLVPGATINDIPKDRQQRTNSNIVCVMRIYADPDGEDSSLSQGHNFGHAFLTFLNCSQEAITIGRFAVEPGKMISVSKFGNFGEYSNNFQGVFYNVETQRKAKLGWYATAESMYIDLTASQLEKVSKYIVAHQKGYFELGSNCALLSAEAWNSALPNNRDQYIDVSGIMTPRIVRKAIEAYGYYYTGNGLLQADFNCCYYDGDKQVYCGDPKIP